MDGEISPSTERIETGNGGGGVAMNRTASMMDDIIMHDVQYPHSPTNRETFCISERSPGVEQVWITAKPTRLQDAAEDVAMDTSWIDFDFGFDTEPQISTSPLDDDLKSSMTSTTTIVSMPNNGRFNRGALTIDTSIVNSAISMASSDTTMCSAVSNPSDIYGWEEELDRRMSIDNRLARPAIARRVTSGGRMTRPRARGDLHSLPFKSVDVKRKGLLYRMFNIRRGLDELSVPASPTAERRISST